MSDERSYNSEYLGWANYQTWNVALWIQNDEGLYDTARGYRNARDPYAELVAALRGFDSFETPDGVAWNDSGIDTDAINDMIQEL